MSIRKEKLEKEDESWHRQTHFSTWHRTRYESGALKFHLKGDLCEFRIDDLWLPTTSASPSYCRLIDDPERIEVCVALCDQAFQRSPNATPDIRSIQKRIAVYRNVLDFLRPRGIYRLSEAMPEHLDWLVTELAIGGWFRALDLEQRWNNAARDLMPENHRFALRFLRRPLREAPVVDALSMPYWSQVIGMGTKNALPRSAQEILEEKLPYNFTARWATRKELPPGPPAKPLLTMLLCWLNDLYHMNGTRDRLSFLPFPGPQETASQLAKSQGGRTATISLDETVRLAQSAFHWMYNCAPHIIGMLEAATRELHLISRKKRKHWLPQNTDALELQKLLGRPVRQWSANQRTVRDDYTADELIAGCQGACAIVIALLNGRRHIEICDEKLGLRSNALRPTELTDVWEIDFYVAKTYRARHDFFVTQATADAIRCLEALRSITLPKLNDTRKERSVSVFWAGRPTLDGIAEDVHFMCGVDAKRTRTLSTFLSWAFSDGTAPKFHTHVARRMFALIYMYRHSDPRLRALSQHLRHFNLVNTRTYVSDLPNGPTANSIDHKFGLAAGGKNVSNAHLAESLYLELQDLRKAIEAAGQDKLLDTVRKILDGNKSTGGFPRLVRHLYRTMCRNITFSNLPGESQARELCGSLIKRGYRVRPKSHGDCHLKERKSAMHPKCEVNGSAHQELAEIKVCNGCVFFSSDEKFQGELHAAEQRWGVNRNDLSLPVLQQLHAEKAYKNVRQLLISIENRGNSGLCE